MSGRALKGARLAKGVLGRMRDRIKHGVQQPPAWYENVRRSPPAPLPRARAADVKRIVLPTDRLAQLYLRKRPDAAREGAPRDGHAQPTAVLFAQRQWELMRREGLSEDAAFARVLLFQKRGLRPQVHVRGQRLHRARQNRARCFWRV